jgi:hypothetical protein
MFSITKGLLLLSSSKNNTYQKKRGITRGKIGKNVHQNP